MRLLTLHEDELDKWDIQNIKDLAGRSEKPANIARQLRIHVDKVKEVLDQDKPKLFSTSGEPKFWKDLRELSPNEVRTKLSAMAHKSARDSNSKYHGKSQPQIWKILWASAIKRGIKLYDDDDPNKPRQVK